jgi:hypothetical protein
MYRPAATSPHRRTRGPRIFRVGQAAHAPHGTGVTRRTGPGSERTLSPASRNRQFHGGDRGGNHTMGHVRRAGSPLPAAHAPQQRLERRGPRGSCARRAATRRPHHRPSPGRRGGGARRRKGMQGHESGSTTRTRRTGHRAVRTGGFTSPRRKEARRVGVRAASAARPYPRHLPRRPPPHGFPRGHTGDTEVSSRAPTGGRP